MEEVNGKLGESPLFDDVGEDLVQGPFTFMGKGIPKFLQSIQQIDSETKFWLSGNIQLLYFQTNVQPNPTSLGELPLSTGVELL